MSQTLVRTFVPRGSCRELFECRDSEVLLAGPAGTGKSRACLEKLHAVALANPGMRGLMLRKTAVSMTSTGLVTFREHVAKEAIDSGLIRWYGGSQQESAQYKYSNGSAVVVGGMDKSTKVMSSEYDLVYVQEATELTENDWEAITTRLRNGKVSFQQLIADCNPDTPYHWLKLRGDSGKTRTFNTRHEENPVLFDDEGQLTAAGAAYMGKLDALTGVRYQRLRLGNWVAAEGQIYEEWEPSVHLLDRFEIPRSWTRWRAVDFGYTNPMVYQWWAEDPDGRLYLYRELYHTRRTVDQIARQVREVDRQFGEPRPRGTVCDHDAEGREVLRRELGLGTQAAIKKVTEGIQATQRRIRKAGDGRPRVYILRDSLVEVDQDLLDAKKPTCTEQEIVGYVWAVKPGGELKEEPLKENDHGCDAMRYMVAARDLVGRPKLRYIG